MDENPYKAPSDSVKHPKNAAVNERPIHKILGTIIAIGAAIVGWFATTYILDIIRAALRE